MIDALKIKTDVKFKSDGYEYTATGAYLSPDGIVVRGKLDDGSIVEGNVPLSKIDSIEGDE